MNIWPMSFVHFLQGFYAVYRVVFELLTEEDIEFMEDKESPQEIPGFGQSDSPYETVFITNFYDMISNQKVV